jgi:putative endonuclease
MRKIKGKKSGWCVYVIECKNGSLYSGITNNLEKRIAMHKAGKGAKYTRSFGVKKLSFKENCRNKSSALKKEAAIKKLSRQKKLDLIKTNKCN